MPPELEPLRRCERWGCSSGKQAEGRQNHSPHHLEGQREQLSPCTPSSLRHPASLTPLAILPPTKLASSIQGFSLWDPPWLPRVTDSRTEPTQTGVQTPKPTGPLQPESLSRPSIRAHTHTPQTHPNLSFQPSFWLLSLNPDHVYPQLLSSFQDSTGVLTLCVPFAVPS